MTEIYGGVWEKEKPKLKVRIVGKALMAWIRGIAWGKEYERKTESERNR